MAVDPSLTPALNHAWFQNFDCEKDISSEVLSTSTSFFFGFISEKLGTTHSYVAVWRGRYASVTNEKKQQPWVKGGKVGMRNRLLL